MITTKQLKLNNKTLYITIDKVIAEQLDLNFGDLVEIDIIRKVK